MQPLFTVGIPVYNGMPYLPESLQSVLQQTYPNFEVVVINDGSTDESLEYLRSIRDPRLRVISQPNRGITAALNRALAEARTPWLVRLDADDIACPDRLALLAEAIQQYPDAGMFYSDADNYRHTRVISKLRTTRGTPEELRAITRSGYLLSICHVTAALNIAKTQSLGGYRFNLYVEDLDLWWRMALRYTVVFLPKVTVSIRLHVASTCISNIEKLTLNTLYVQYLLLSHLWQLSPLGYEAVVPYLIEMIDKGRLRYRHQMWLAGGQMGTGQYHRAVPYLVSALINSPKNFFDRLRYPFFPGAAVQRGEDPAQFRQRQRLLWRSDTRSLGEAI
jgi:glycosyltransferase involved in cell wall biosynthesis